MAKDTTWETEKDEEPMTDEATETTEEESAFDPIEFDDELIEELPPSAGSLYADAIGALIAKSEDGYGWLRVKTGGREPNSVQTGLQGAARKLGVSIKTRTRPNNGSKDVWVSLTEDDGGDEEE